MNRNLSALFAAAALAAPAVAMADPVIWVDWTSGTAGANGVAEGTITIGSEVVDVDYEGEIAFIQTSGGTNYWNPSAPYESTLVDNAPPAADIIALSTATSKTLTFSRAIDNLFFAVVSLNGNGYKFSEDFEIVSSGCGYWGCGGFAQVDNGDGTFNLNSTGGEPHGVIRFTGAVTDITWTSLTNEYWNGFTVGTYGLAHEGVPEPATWAMMIMGFGAVGYTVRRRRVAAAFAA
jgi:hypothetical protein